MLLSRAGLSYKPFLILVRAVFALGKVGPKEGAKDGPVVNFSRPVCELRGRGQSSLSAIKAMESELLINQLLLGPKPINGSTTHSGSTAKVTNATLRFEPTPNLLTRAANM
jgi:hypothetical protein